MNVKIICFDLDGTFLDDRKNIPQKNLAALETAASRGIHIVPATGRIYQGIPEDLRRLPFMRWFITANGAFIYDALRDQVAVRSEIPVPRAVEFLAYMDSLGVLYDCYLNNWGYMTESMLSIVPAFIPDPGIRKLVTGLRSPVPELKAYLQEKGADVQKLQLYFKDMELRARLLKELPSRYPDLCFSSSLPFNIEINAGTATKGQALLALCSLLDISHEDSIAFGDGTNDLDMLLNAGAGIAMSNAAPELLAAADYITLSNNDAGVGAGIEHFLTV